MHSIIDPLSPPSLLPLIYVDDLLTASSISLAHCSHHTSSIHTTLTKNKFFIHPPGSKKTSLSPSTSANFIGKNISSGNFPTLSNTSATNITTLFYTLIASTIPLTQKQVQSMAGHLQWASMHNLLPQPFFYTLHRLALIPPPHYTLLAPGTASHCSLATSCLPSPGP
eukprot:Phypoly_transcript_07933.p1 GENE.Phypoly_transcript_07933~~Phypoly_transcript_07933.p1  ORF type:complete len:168 (+),score=41.96 Phypoly_transcript_07933:85-588(+)